MAEDDLTLERVEDWHKQLKEQRKRVEEQWDIQQKLYDGDYDFKVPDLVTQKGLKLRASKGSQIVHTLAEHMTTEEAQIHCDPRDKENQLDIDAATNVEEWAGAWLHQQSVNAFLELREPPARAASKLLALRDMAVLKVMYDVDAVTNSPERRDGDTAELYKSAVRRWERDSQNASPILLRTRDPVCVYIDSGGRYAIETYMRSRSEIEDIYDLELKGNAGNSKLVKWLECWTPTQRLYAAGGEVLEISKHRYGFIPYVIGYGGWGQGSTMAPGQADNVETDGGMHRMITGALWSVRGELEARARRMTHADFLLHQYAYAMPGITGATREIDDDFAVQWGTGNPTVYPEGTQPVWNRPDLPLRDILEFIATVDHDIARATVPDILAGFRPQGVDTARQTELLATFGRMKIGPAIASLNAMFTKALEYALRLIEDVIEQPVTIIGDSRRDPKNPRRIIRGCTSYTLDPAELHRVYFPEVRFIPTLPLDRSGNIAMGKQIEDKITRETFLEDYAGMEDGAQEAERKRKEIIADAIDAAILEATMPAIQAAAITGLPQQVPQLVTAEQERGGMAPPMPMQPPRLGMG